ncbi:leucine-rich repeat protein [Adlercreutzia caecimuris]|uniref:leucine-rich repeat protein n=2 Tax=Adlercreutzia caecimuris TaxID=671266 RepID=UPI00272B8A03|nr:leucine-rich repeat protein [Adlercreutzia caecimuris]
MKSTWLSAAVSLALVFGLMPSNAFAEEADTKQDSSVARIEAEATKTPEMTEKAPVEDEEAGSSPLAQAVSGQSDGVQDGAKILESGILESGLTWEYWDNASLVIKGEGSMGDFADKTSQPWNKYLRSMEEVIIEEGVTTIGNYAFADADYLGQAVEGEGALQLPSTLVSIGKNAFYDCDGMTEIIVPDSVAEIGEWAFAVCDRLKSCHLPESLTVISDSLFYKDYKLEEVNIPSGVTEIQKDAFNQQFFASDPRVGIKSIVLPEGLKKIAGFAFRQCLIRSDVTLPASLEACGDSWGGFYDAHIAGDLILSEGINPNAIKAQGGSAARVIYPVNFSKDANFFARDEYVVPESNTELASVDGCLFSRKGERVTYESNTAVLEAIPSERTGTYVVPEGTLETGWSSLLNNKIEEVVLPASLINAPTKNLRGHGTLKSITVPEGNAVYASSGGMLFSKDRTQLLFSPPKNEFENGICILPNTVTSIEFDAFQCCVNLRYLSLPPGLSAIPDSFAYECSGLVAIWIPASVTKIGDASWVDYRNQSRRGISIFYEGTSEQWQTLTSGDTHVLVSNSEADVYCGVAAGGESGDGLLYYLDDNNRLFLTADRMVNGTPISSIVAADGHGRWHEFEERTESIEVSSSINTIGADSFAGFTTVGTVVLPASVTAVEGGAFADCPSLARVECQGAPFETFEGATSSRPSLSSQAVIYCYPGNGWTEAADYDSGSGTWKGYRLVEQESAVLPEIGSVEYVKDGKSVTAVKVEGGHAYSQTAVKVRVLSKEGRDITGKVAISVASSPERTVELSRGSKGDAAFNVTFRGTDNSLLVGSHALAGDYRIRVSPQQYQAGGEEREFTFTVTRNPERILDSWSVSIPDLEGRRAWQEKQSIRMDVWNQYFETVRHRATFRLIDKISGKEITAEAEKYGIGLAGLISDARVEISNMAPPRHYVFRFDGNGTDLAHAFEGEINLTRRASYLNVPYALTLTGGDETIVESDTEQWASKPYRVRVLDCYDDPVWPELTWKVTDPSGSDVTANFEVDEQGYLYTKNSAQLLANYGEGAVFRITASTWDSVRKQMIESNSLEIRLAKAEPPQPVTHTATFMVGDEVVGRVVFAEGDASLKEPAMPVRENYVGKWEDYDLAAATGDITVRGTYEPINPDAVSDITGEASASYDKSTVTINLAAVAATKFIKVESKKTKPMDVVLVLDQSGSMTQKLGSQRQTKQTALKQCANQFVQQLYENAKKTGADHRVALVGFACSEYVASGYASWKYLNTGLLATQSGGKYSYQDLRRNASPYRNALIPVNQQGRLNSRITNGINSIEAQGATAADLGLEMANNIFSYNPIPAEGEGSDRERVVLFVTDGVPTDWTETADRITRTAARALAQANVIKQSQGARIYSIGVDVKANPLAPFAATSGSQKVSSDGIITDRYNRYVGYDFNKFLHAMSSNYSKATAMAKMGDGAQDAGYYLAVNDTAALSKIFSSILYSTVYSVSSFDRATLSYTLPAGFVFSLKQEEEMRTALAAQGLTDEDIAVVREGETTTLTFSNVRVRSETVGGIQRFVARVSFQASVEKDVAGNVAAGSGAVEVGGEVFPVTAPAVTVPADRCLLVFKMNGEVYEQRETELSAPIAVPDTDMARWLDLEQMEDPIITGAYTEFETDTLQRAYHLNWLMGNSSQTAKVRVRALTAPRAIAVGSKLEFYQPCGVVNAPSEVVAAVPAGMEISHWQPASPQTMPARNMTCVAILTPAHEHGYTHGEYRTGTCEEGVTIHRQCACGEEEEEQLASKAHRFGVILDENAFGDAVANVVCGDCGQSAGTVTYRAAYLDTLGVALMEVGDGSPADSSALVPWEMGVRAYLGDYLSEDDVASWQVVRLDRGGLKVPCVTTVENGFVEFDAAQAGLYMCLPAQADLASYNYDECLAAFDSYEPPMPSGPLPEEAENPRDPSGGSESNPAPPKPSQPQKPSTSSAPSGSPAERPAAPVSLAGAAITVKPKTYTGKTLKPAVPTVKIGGKALRYGVDFTYSCKGGKKVGSYKATITGKGAYAGTKTATFQIVPKGTSVKKLSKARKAFTVKWKKPSKANLKQTTGYQVRWSTSKRFTKKTTKTKTVKTTSKAGKTCQLKVTKLKAKKKYYVQVRTYKKVGGKTYCSSWSKAKAVKTKR